MIEQLTEIDNELLLLINGANSPWLDTVMYWVSEKTTWIPLYVVCVFALWKALGTRAALIAALLAIGAVGLADWGSVHWFKEAFQRYRPCHNLDIQAYLHLVEGHCGGKFGFVSSHAANHFAVATFLSATIGRRWRWTRFAFVAWASLITISRVYLGVHYPSDVLVGGLFGIFIGAIAVFLLDRFVLRRNLKP